MNRTKKFLLVILILLFILCAVGFVCCTYNHAHADSEELVTFNQSFREIDSNYYRLYNINLVINYGYNSATLNYNGYNTTHGYDFSLQAYNHTLNYIQGHKYYLSIDVNASYEGIVNWELWQNWSQFPETNEFKTIPNTTKRFRYISTCNTTVTKSNSLIYVGDGVNNNTAIVTYSNIILIDLTLMYGNNIPDNETIYNLFNALYYPYTTGTIMYSNGIEQYNAALNNIFSSYTFHTNIDALAKDTFAVEYDNQEANFIYDAEHSMWYFKNTFGVPLSIGLKQGSRITINYNVFAGGGSGQSTHLFLNIMYNNGNNFVNLYTDPNGIQLSAMDNQSLTFILPTEVDCLYFNIFDSDLNKIDTSMNLILVQFEINCSQLDITSTINNALLTGIKQGHEDFKEGTQNYKMIFDKGYNDAVMRLTADASLKFMDYFSQAFQILGSILNIEVFPNVTLGSFFLLPIMTSLLFFIIKLIKGGS